MPKAVISNRIYMDLPPNKKEIFDALTYKISNGAANPRFEQTEIIRNYRMVTPAIVSIPQGRSDLIPPGYEVVDKRIIEFADFPAPTRELFEEQKVVYDKVDDSCFINALPGWGKTFTALHISRNLGQKTLVVTHTAALRDQWVGEVEKLYGISPGIIGGGVYNDSGPIVVSNIQSLVKNKDRIAKSYGTIIMDEAHHVPASTFTEIINDSHARYRIALSGTMTRKDGRHILFKDYFGPKLFRPPQNNTMEPTIKLVKTNMKLPPAKTWADKVTALLQDEDYQDFIASMALVQARRGHKVLIIADRVDFLQKVTEMLGDRATLVVGETQDREKELNKIYSGECDIIGGSRQIFSEGISVNPLSCVILAVPLASTSALEQIIGRVMRLHPGKLDPIVMDVQFSGPAEKRQNSTRIGFYITKGWKIDTI